MLALLTGACATNVRVDPEGYLCDPGDQCPVGYACVQGVCTKAVDPCAMVTCQPRAPECTSGMSVRSYGVHCVSGACVTDVVDKTCAAGCRDGTCKDLCTDVMCTTPPTATCVDAATLRSFDTTGTCAPSSGNCTYASTDTSCPNGCEAGHCRAACTTGTCTTPPAATCVGQTARTWASPGTCDTASGQCSYVSMDTACPNGCVKGACVTPLSFTQVGPRVRFAVNAIDLAPQGGAALAVGNQGRVARWNGTEWVELNGPSTSDLNRVQYSSTQLAWISGRNRALWQVRAGGVTPISLSGGGNPNLVALSVRGDTNVLVTDISGGYWKLSGTSWSTGTLPSADGPYTMRAAFIDESNRERVVGLCGPLGNRVSCVAYRNTGSWFVDTDVGSLGFDAVGGSFSVPTTLTSESMAGQADNVLGTHVLTGAINHVAPNPTLEGAGIVGIAADSTATGPRTVYVLTSSANSKLGHLYALEKTSTQVSARALLNVSLGDEALAPTVATGASGGVLVADTNRVANANTIIRHTSSTDEVLDIGEDFVGASLDSQGTMYAASATGALGIRATNANVWQLVRAPSATFTAVEARNGSDVLLTGKDSVTGDGVVFRWSPSAGFTRVLTKPGVSFTALCRVSDSEGWVVGSGGAVVAVSTSGASAVSSSTSKDLRSVDCFGGQAVACGAEGTVLRASNGTWAAVQPAFPDTTSALTQCRIVGAAVWALGDGVFQRFDGTTWTANPPRAGLVGLVIRNDMEAYGTVVTAPASSTSPGSSAVFRFDGTQWLQSLAVTGVLGQGAGSTNRVIFSGSGGLLVDGR